MPPDPTAQDPVRSDSATPPSPPAAPEVLGDCSTRLRMPEPSQSRIISAQEWADKFWARLRVLWVVKRFEARRLRLRCGWRGVRWLGAAVLVAVLVLSRVWLRQDLERDIKHFAERAEHFTTGFFGHNPPAAAAHLATVFAALAAGWWFLFSASFRKKIQLEIQCSTFGEPGWRDRKLVELSFLLTNKGQVENRCYTLAYEIWSIDPIKREADERHLVKRSCNIVPVDAGYYYVRAGVTLRITARLWISTDISAIRVKAFILHRHYRREVSIEKDLFAQMYQHPDWTALDRVFSMSSDTGMRGVFYDELMRLASDRAGGGARSSAGYCA